jgi:hypothetical protein
MINQITESFFEWLDESGLKPADVCQTLGNTSSTIATWRSKGVPKSKQQLCLMMINQAHAKAQTEPTVSFTLRPTYDEFRKWNKASLASGMIVEDWAEHVMNRAADEYFKQT